MEAARRHSGGEREVRIEPAFIFKMIFLRDELSGGPRPRADRAGLWDGLEVGQLAFQ